MKRRFPFGLLISILGVVLLLLLSIHLTQGETTLDLSTLLTALYSPDDSRTHTIIRYLRLPRATLSIVVGAALGVSGVVLQTITRNPLASPTTLGINAGAYLAITIATVFAPQIVSASPFLIALVGGLLAAGLVYAITTASGFTPIRLTLAGAAVSLALAAFTAALQLIYENETKDLFFWGSGSLLQTDWSGTLYAAPRVFLGILIVFGLVKALDLLALGEDVARSLGGKVQRTQALAAFLAVCLAAVAVSVTGPIGFVGLIAPHFMKLIGYQRHCFLIPGAALWGAVILLGADVLAQQITTNLSELPTGGITTLVGAPFLVWLARCFNQLGGNVTQQSISAVKTPKLSLNQIWCFACLLLVIVLVAGLLFGNTTLSVDQLITTFQGSGTALSRTIILNLRLPRMLVAMFSGASLAVSGLLLQGVVRNPLAGPEIIGVSSGAGLGAMFVLTLVPDAPPEWIPFAAGIGAIAAFGAVYLLAWRQGISVIRLALMGIAVSAFCSAGINLLVVVAKLRVAQALVWLTGSTYAQQWDDVRRLILFAIPLLCLAKVLARQLDVMALGEDVSRGLGLSLERMRGVATAIAVSLCAIAVATVGTISFVGLIAPHIARVLVGYRHRTLVPMTALFGAILVAFADLVGRIAIAPKEIPAGLMTALIGAPYFIWLLLAKRT